MTKYRLRVIRAILKCDVMNRKEFKIAWYLQASSPNRQAPSITTDASKGCVVMAESISTIDKFTTNRFGIVLNVLRLQNPAIINVFPITDKIANTTAIIDSNTTMTSVRWGKLNPSSLSSILEIFPVYRASDRFENHDQSF